MSLDVTCGKRRSGSGLSAYTARGLVLQPSGEALVETGFALAHLAHLPAPDDGGVVQVAVASGNGVLQEAFVRARERQLEWARGKHGTNVLEVLADARFGRVIARHHLLPLGERCGRGRGRGAHEVQELPPRNAERLREGDALGERSAIESEHEV